MSEREWRIYIDDMLRFAEKVRTYSEGIDRATFQQDELKYDAILRNLELIGEAATHVPAEVREQHEDIPWRQVIENGKAGEGDERQIKLRFQSLGAAQCDSRMHNHTRRFCS